MVAESPDFKSSNLPGFPATVTLPFASKLKVSSFASPPPFTFSFIVKVLFAGSTLTTSPTTVWLLDFVVAFWAATDIVARPSMHTATRLRINSLRIVTYLLPQVLATPVPKSRRPSASLTNNSKGMIWNIPIRPVRQDSRARLRRFVNHPGRPMHHLVHARPPRHALRRRLHRRHHFGRDGTARTSSDGTEGCAGSCREDGRRRRRSFPSAAPARGAASRGPRTRCRYPGSRSPGRPRPSSVELPEADPRYRWSRPRPAGRPARSPTRAAGRSPARGAA